MSGGSDGFPPPQSPLKNGCEDEWCWSRFEKSHEVRLYGSKLRTAHFHPNWSNGTAGVRGTRLLNRGRYYWEVRVSQRVFGTSMMFGVGTTKARLHVDAFVNMLGEDEHGWGLSHKGLLWHDGKYVAYTKPFRENEATTVGMLFDGLRGTLTFYKDGVSLGVAFSGLHRIDEPLYPVVCSTAAKTEMTLSTLRRDFLSLQDRCRATILRHVGCSDGGGGGRREGRPDVGALDALQLPNRLKAYLMEDGTTTTANASAAAVTAHIETATSNATKGRNNGFAVCYYV